MVKLLEKKVADVKLSAGRGCGVVGLKFFGKVDFEFQRNLVIILSLLIIFSDLRRFFTYLTVKLPLKSD